MHYKKIIYSFFALALLVGAVLATEQTKTREVEAGNAENLRGYGWADNIGWVSFNNLTDGSPHNYGVNKNNDGTLSGYAWSDNIGWIRFNPSFTGPAGASDAHGARINPDNTLTGWARACTATVSSDCLSADRDADWDGWIKFTHSSQNTSNTFFDGAAWGSFLVGWIDVSRVCVFDGNDCDNGGGGDHISISLTGRMTASGMWPTAETIVLDTQAEANAGVDIFWNSTGQNKTCEQVTLDGVPLNIAPGDRNNGTRTVPNLSEGVHVFSYTCQDDNTDPPTDLEPAQLFVNVNTLGNQSCAGAIQGDLRSNSAQTVSYTPCSGDGVGPGTWAKVNTCSAARCEFTQSVTCRAGYAKVNGECQQVQSTIEEF